LIAYFYYSASKEVQIVILYPEYTEAKIKPLNVYIASRKTIHSLVKSKGNIYSNIYNNEPEQPLELVQDQNSGNFPDSIGMIIEDSKFDISRNQEIFGDGSDMQGKYFLLLGALKSRSQAVASAQEMIDKNSKILSGLKIHIVKTMGVDNKFFYMIKADGYNDMNKAKSTCAKLTKLGMECTTLDYRFDMR
jgi:hypothetical protein